MSREFLNGWFNNVDCLVLQSDKLTYIANLRIIGAPLARQSEHHLVQYRIAGKFGGGKVWRIDSFRAFGERKFGELIDQPRDY